MIKTLVLFNGVLSKDTNSNVYVSEDGFIIEPNAIWAKNEILSYYKSEKLNGNDLNKTFHKSWSVIKNSSRYELYVEQIQHYLSTYGSNFSSEVYIPEEVLDLPNTKITFNVIKAYTRSELITKALGLLKSGIALKSETIDMVLSILSDELDYTFTGKEGIKNKEAIIKIADLYNVLPNDTIDFFRYIIYRSTEDSLLIKSKESIDKIKHSSFNPSVQFKQFGLDRLASIFNRFKPLFLAFKTKCPSTINKISKLSKTLHKPLVSNPLNLVTSVKLGVNDTHWLDNATPFALFKALSICHNRLEGQDAFVYRIRNGKSYTKENHNKNVEVLESNYKTIISYLKSKYDFSGKKFYIPSNVEYALPTSEKMFVGNVPTGTRFTGKKLAAGIYWENSWGASDLDLSSINIGGKIGWNSSYNQNDGDLMFSGDITDARNGAVEYLYANKGLKYPTLVMNNVFSGSEKSGFKIVVGKGSDIDNEYMMNPNKLFVDIKTQSVQKQSIIGMFIPKKDKQTFVILNFGNGDLNVSNSSVLNNLSNKALFQQWSNALTINKLFVELGAELVKKSYYKEYNDIEEIVDLSVNKLEKDTFISLFSEKEEDSVTTVDSKSEKV